MLFINRLLHWPMFLWYWLCWVQTGQILPVCAGPPLRQPLVSRWTLEESQFLGPDSTVTSQSPSISMLDLKLAKMIDWCVLIKGLCSICYFLRMGTPAIFFLSSGTALCQLITSILLDLYSVMSATALKQGSHWPVQGTARRIPRPPRGNLVIYRRMIKDNVFHRVTVHLHRHSRLHPYTQIVQ